MKSLSVNITISEMYKSHLIILMHKWTLSDVYTKFLQTRRHETQFGYIAALKYLLLLLH